MALGQRVAARRKEIGLTMVDVANHIGVSQAAVNNMEKRDAQSSKYAEKLANLLCVSVEWLITGEGLKEISAKIYALPVIPINWLIGSIIDEPKKLATVTEMFNVFGPEAITEWIPVMTDFSDRGFAITVQGDSMISPNGHSFPDGSKAIFELYPNGEQLQTANLVLAIMKRSNQITFKKYINEGGQECLAPLNPQYPIMEGDFKVLAVYRFGIIY